MFVGMVKVIYLNIHQHQNIVISVDIMQLDAMWCNVGSNEIHIN